MYSRLCPSCSAAVVGCVKWQAGHNASRVFASRPRNTRLASANYAYTKAHSARTLSYSSHTALHSKRGVSSHSNSDCAYRVPQSPLSYMSSSGLTSAAEQSLRLSHARRRVGNTQRAGLGDSSRRSLGSTAGVYAINLFQSDASAPTQQVSLTFTYSCHATPIAFGSAFQSGPLWAGLHLTAVSHNPISRPELGTG